MIALIQRVERASVEIDGKVHSNIGMGFLILLGVKKGDARENAEALAAKTSMLRIFQDEEGKMNRSLKDTGGEALVVSQFTLCTDNGKSGNRPSFTEAAPPDKAEDLYNYFTECLESNLGKGKVGKGVFAAMMKVELVNDGPVTIILEK